MRVRFMASAIIALLMIGSLVGVRTAAASWAFMFVVNDGKQYVVTDESVDPARIGKLIGKVTKFSDEEGSYSGNFSYRYPKGTGYYAIDGVDPDEAIAVKVKETAYVKATYNGEYGGAKGSSGGGGLAGRGADNGGGGRAGDGVSDITSGRAGAVNPSPGSSDVKRLAPYAVAAAILLALAAGWILRRRVRR